MSSLKVFEIAGSIAGLAGISLTVFFFLFKTIIQKALPSLTRNSRRNIIILMLFMVWSVTIVGMTTWIYSSTSDDGGKQPTIEEAEIAKETSAELSKQESVVKASMMHTMVANIGNASTLQLSKNGKQFEYINHDDEETCGLKVRSSLWVSFNDIQPYFTTFQEERVKVILKEMDAEKNEATFVMKIREEGESVKLYHFTLNKNDFYNFKYSGCDYRFYYRGKTSWTTGVKYWFQTRYVAHFSIAPLEV